MKFKILTILAFSAATLTPAMAAERVPLSSLNKALHHLAKSYGDVPSSVDCASPKAGSAVAIICVSPYLKAAELLSTRAQAYAEENATKSEVNHASYRGDIPTNCKSEDCIYSAFRTQTDAAMGGESPYFKFYGHALDEGKP